MKKLATLIVVFLLITPIFADFFVVDVAGKAEIFKNGIWIALKNGDAVKEGDTIQTGFRSSLILEKDGVNIKYGPLTRMTVEQSTENTTRVFIASGSCKSNIEPNRRLGFTVRTPVATASVRGTEFDVQTTFNYVSITTIRGVVAVWNNASADAPRNAVLVAQGQTVQMTNTGNVVAQNENAISSVQSSIISPSENQFTNNSPTEEIQQSGSLRIDVEFE